MPSSGMLRRVALVRIEVCVVRIASVIRATRIAELASSLASYYVHFHPDDGSAVFLPNVGSYKNHTT
jgi:hypothetical protein